MQRPQESAPGIEIHRHMINNLKFANDIKLNEEGMETTNKSVYQESLLSAGGGEKEIK